MTARMKSIALALVAPAVLAGFALAAPAPDSSALARLNVSAGEWNRFRIVAGRSQFLVSSLRPDPEGVAVRDPQRRQAVVVTTDAREEPRRVAWSEIESIEGARSNAARGAITGALVGGLVGLVVKAAIGNGLHDASGVAIVAIPIGAACGGVIGVLARGTSGWHPLYP